MREPNLTEPLPPAPISVIERTRVPLGPIILTDVYGGRSDWVILPGFKMERQCHTRWCWAAVGQAVSCYYNPSSDCTQRAIAKLQMPGYTFSEECYSDSTISEDERLPYNVPKVLKSVLCQIKCWDHGEIAPGSLMDVLQWIDGDQLGGRPVCVRIEWPNGTTHFVVIDGYLRGTEKLRVWDPWGPQCHELMYDDLVDHYTPDAGKWLNTLYTKHSTQKCTDV